MARVLNLVSQLQKWGLKVEYVNGWTTRGNASFSPEAVIDHWTAGPAESKTRPSLNVVVNGRPGLPGPLCNVYLDRNGVCVVVASGRANHAGYGLWQGLTGNSKLLGIEAEAANNSDWTEAQRVAYPVLNAALLTIIGKDTKFLAGHSEYALPKGRKIDINGYTMASMRKQTASVMKDGPAKTKARLAGKNPKPPEVKPPVSQPSTPKPPAGKEIQSWTNQPNGSATFPRTYADLVIDGEFKALTVGAQQILMELISVGIRYNQRWDGDWGARTVKDAQEWLRWNGFYKKATNGHPLAIDGVDGYWFWYELQRFLKSRGFYNKTDKGVTLKLDGKPEYWTIAGWQRYLNTQN